jgi:Ras family protein
MVTIIRDKILNFTGTDWAPIVLVGNKTDLEGQRQVSKEEGEELASKWKCLSCETSAKWGVNIGKYTYSREKERCEEGTNVCIFIFTIVRVGL